MQTTYTPDELAAVIDHTCLKADAVPDQIEALCREAAQYQFCAVCVNAGYVQQAARCLSAEPVNICTVVGFPLGADEAATKAFAAERAIRQGAVEVDTVLAIGRMKAGETDRVRADVQAVAEVCRGANTICKVILETCLLTDDEKRVACSICVDAGAHFVKTSTGMSTGGATVEDIALMSSIVAPQGLGVKASGGVRTLEDAEAMLNAGATRIGASSSVAIMEAAFKRASA